jgi:hypothetical protein
MPRALEFKPKSPHPAVAGMAKLHRAADPKFDAALYPRVLHRTCPRGTAPA